MKAISSLIVLIILIGCKVQSNNAVPENWKKENPYFINQGEVEDYNAYKIFKENYKVQRFQRFEGNVKNMTDSIAYNESVMVLNCNDNLKAIFKNGLLYPEILCSDTLFGGIRRVTNIKELKLLNPSRKVKRFSLWLFRKRMHNPSVYLFELTNDEAKNDMSIEEFIDGAQLTFFSYGWLII